MGEPANYNRKEFVYRVGTFFLLLGVGALIFFMLSEAVEQPQFNYFCGSMVFLVLGFMFRAQYKKAAVSSGRFSVLKRILKRGGGGGSSAAEEEEYEDE
ncbi:MAG TPA: hypothetical protein VJ972_08115 [Anaerolineales bacterium]|nr:hypothetical protein [Anaerolineales bacterium]